MLCPRVIDDFRQDGRGRLDVADSREETKWRHSGEPLTFFRFGLTRTDPRLQPAFMRQCQSVSLARRRVWRLLVNINRQQAADGRAVVAPSGEGIRATQHQKPAAAPAHKIL